MAKEKGGPHSDAGQDCPAQKLFKAPTEITINGERLRIVQATDEEGAAITQFLKERAESAPAGVHVGRASALVRAGVKFGAVVLLATGVGLGLGDGNVFDDAGCSVAQQPRRASAEPGQTEEHPDGKAPGSDGGIGGSVPDGPSVGDEDGGLTIEDGGEHRTSNIQHPTSNSDKSRAGIESGDPRSECEMRVDGTNRTEGTHWGDVPGGTVAAPLANARIVDVPGGMPALPAPKSGTAEILQAILHQTVLLNRIVRGQEKLLATTAAEPRLGIQAIGANKELRTIGRFKYGAGFKDVWLGDEHYNLRGRAKARICLQYLVQKKAFQVRSARHFLNEIDPHVRKQGDFILLQNIRIKDYFNDPDGRLQRLRQALVQPVGGNGKYYLKT
jgi:hypothetical protein